MIGLEGFLSGEMAFDPRAIDDSAVVGSAPAEGFFPVLFFLGFGLGMRLLLEIRFGRTRGFALLACQASVHGRCRGSILVPSARARQASEYRRRQP